MQVAGGITVDAVVGHGSTFCVTPPGFFPGTINAVENPRPGLK
jgi:hypothetical protein